MFSIKPSGAIHHIFGNVYAAGLRACTPLFAWSLQIKASSNDFISIKNRTSFQISYFYMQISKLWFNLSVKHKLNMEINHVDIFLIFFFFAFIYSSLAYLCQVTNVSPLHVCCFARPIWLCEFNVVE